MFLLLISVGFVAERVYNMISKCDKNPFITAFIFDLAIFVIMITGLYYFKGILTVTELLVYFDCLSFVRKYALLATWIGIVLAIIWGFIMKCCCKKWFKFF